jgi:uncharacterized protein (DUF697 family)/predicted GTPase
MSSDSKQNLSASSSIIEKLFRETPPDVSEQLERAIARTPAPVVWLLGKTQSGKSSIVKTLTGESRIEIGEGYKACTESASVYTYPSEEAPILRFLDTRGLEEASYDPSEDLELFSKDANILLVVVRAADRNLDGILSTLASIKKKKAWPVILVQTRLHDLYFEGVTHPLTTSIEDEESPEYAELQKSLKLQRSLFSPYIDKCIAIDFTEESSHEPSDYGRDELLNLLREVLPEVAWGLFSNQDRSVLRRAHWRKAQAHIVSYAAASASIGAVPLPLLDLPGQAALHLKMLHSIARIYRQPLNWERVSEIFAALGLTYGMRMSGRSLSKLLPGGSIIYAGYSGAMTFALGNAFCAYFEIVQEGSKPSPEQLREAFNRAKAQKQNYSASTEVH